MPRPSLQVLDTITAPAIVRNGRMDLLAVNHLGRAMHSSLYDGDPAHQPNFARYTFLDDDSRRFYPDWDGAADTCVAILRTEAGRDPHDGGMHRRWGNRPPAARTSAVGGARNVRYHGAGTKRFHHQVVGDLELAYESVDMISEPGLTLTITRQNRPPRPRTPSLLASWAATQDAETIIQSAGACDLTQLIRISGGARQRTSAEPTNPPLPTTTTRKPQALHPKARSPQPRGGTTPRRSPSSDRSEGRPVQKRTLGRDGLEVSPSGLAA